MNKKGLIHVYYGLGKGKTTAALGLALRASGWGWKVIIVQFLKSAPCGELFSLSQLSNITVLRGKAGKGFVEAMDETMKKETKKTHDANLRQAVGLVRKGQCDLLVLDEVLDALQFGLIDEEEFAGLIHNKPPALELVITGHKPIQWVVDQADYVTEMCKVKHPYDIGIKARKGIEF